jgi:hypothetical protein
MWDNADLKNHFKTSNGIKSSSFVTAEWNLNDWENIERVGNYRYRHYFANDPYAVIEPYYDPYDVDGNYTGATDSDIEVFGPYDQDSGIYENVLFEDDRFAYYYSLDECFSPNRPRSGINKILYFPTKNIDDFKDIDRPRYYLSHADDKFKYWTSWHTEKGNIYGLSDNFALSTDRPYFPIHDAAPFVVYKNDVRSNKIVVKMQTNIEKDYGQTPLANDELGTEVHDDGYRYRFSTTPVEWKLELLKEDSSGRLVWTDSGVVLDGDTGKDTYKKPFAPSDGYVEFVWSFSNWNRDWGSPKYMGDLPNDSLLPKSGVNGRYFVVGECDSNNYCVYVWHDNKWNCKSGADALVQGWALRTDFDETGEYCVRDFAGTGSSILKEVDEFRGIRIVVDTMNTPNTPLDIIEISPRIKIDLTSHTKSFSITKSMGKVDELAVPISGLKPSTGSIDIFDESGAFNPYQVDDKCLIAGLESSTADFSFYDVISLEESGDLVDYYIPLKHLSSDVATAGKTSVSDVSFQLRDKFHLFERESAPSIFLRDVSLSFAVTVLLDSIGFSNYTFDRGTDTKVARIPYFYVSNDKSVAEVLEQLAVATQTVMYFDEYNNLVVKYKESVYDNSNAVEIRGNTTSSGQSEIMSFDSIEKKIYTSGTVNFTQRYIQRTMGSLEQFNYSDEDKEWIYLPALLWEASGDLVTRSINEKAGNASGYGLTALALDRPLSDKVPVYDANASGLDGVDKVLNNEIYVGASARWMYRYAGYFYAGGEVIKYDAVEWAYTKKQGDKSVVVTSWVEDVDQWSEIFGNLPYRGKMYPTGKIRIFAEVVDKKVVSHGRGQFNTDVVSHSAGIPSEWTSKANTYGFEQDTDYLFTPYEPDENKWSSGKLVMKNDYVRKKSKRSGKMKDFLKEAKVETNFQPATIQASALNFTGANHPSLARDYISIQTKKLGGAYKHFGTRMRVIGKIEATANSTQTPAGGYSIDGGITLNGGSGGICFGYNKSNGDGYFFEILALSNLNQTNDDGDTELVNEDNVILWKNKGGKTQKLWGGFADIVVDSGDFAGQGRLIGEELPTVYDLDIEYVRTAKGIVLYLFINNNLISIYEDNNPVNITSTIGLFTRGGSRCMFENVFALRQNATQSVEGNIVKVGTSSDVFQIGSQQGNQSVAGLDFVGLKKYGISGFVKEGYLKDISPNSSNGGKIYYEEFGTILREGAMINAKFDKAYPALNAKPSPSVSLIPGYAISGYEADAYSAQFFIMNVTDTFMNLDEQTGNYLTLLGIAFTQNNQYEITMDDYFKKRSKISDSWKEGRDNYKRLQIKRLSVGESQFTFESEYVQTWDAAENIMEFLVDKTTRERKLIGMSIFPNPLLQLGDKITINHEVDGHYSVDPKKVFVVYNIEHGRDSSGENMKIYVSEV